MAEHDHEPLTVSEAAAWKDGYQTAIMDMRTAVMGDAGKRLAERVRSFDAAPEEFGARRSMIGTGA